MFVLPYSYSTEIHSFEGINLNSLTTLFPRKMKTNSHSHDLNLELPFQSVIRGKFNSTTQKEGDEPLSRTSITVENYGVVGRRLMRFCRSDEGLDEGETVPPMVLAKWFADRRSQITAGTFAIERQSVLLMLEPKSDVKEYRDAIAEINALRAAKVCKPSQKIKNTPKGQISRADYDRLDSIARNDKSFLLRFAITMVLASCDAGLRPTEWVDAKLVELNSIEFVPKEPDSIFDESEVVPAIVKKLEERDDTFVSSMALIVINRKTTNNKGHGYRRIIPLLRTDHVSGLLEMFASWRAANPLKSVTSLMESARTTLARRRAHDLSLSRRDKYGRTDIITTDIIRYSGRNQYQANMKRMLSIMQVSYLAGHKNTISSVSSYQRRKRGWKQIELMADVEKLHKDAK